MIVKPLSLLAVLFMVFAFCNVAHAQVSRCGSTPPKDMRVPGLAESGEFSWCVCRGVNRLGTGQLVYQRVTKALDFLGGDDMWTADGWSEYTKLNWVDEWDHRRNGPYHFDDWSFHYNRYYCWWTGRPVAPDGSPILLSKEAPPM